MDKYVEKITDNGGCVFSQNEPLCHTMDKIGVPRDDRWRSLILYMRSLQYYIFLTDQQKSQIQALVMRTLAKKNFSDEAFQVLLRQKEEILNGPCQRKLQAALEETAEMLLEVKRVILDRRGNVEEIEKIAVDCIREGEEPEKIVATLRKAFHQVLEAMERDAHDLTKLSHTDALTSLNNRRALDEFMGDVVAEWVATPKPVSMMMIDIDHFKNFNDKYGHLIGDQALITVAALIKEYGLSVNKRRGVEYFPARYGGEEFSVVLPGSDLEDSYKYAEELRSAIEKYDFTIRNSQGEILEHNIKITVSIGVAELDNHWEGAFCENLVDCSDKALYAAKESGRNKVVKFSQKDK